MNCRQCGAPLDISATNDNYLRCRRCRLLFVVKKDGELTPFAVEAPDGADQAEFFAAFTHNLGFEDDEDVESAPATAPAAKGRGWVWFAVLMALGAAALAVTRGVFR